MEPQILVRSAALLASLGHPARIQIVCLLAEGDLNVSEITDALQLPQSNVSQHLAALLRTGVLRVTPKGTSRRYQVRGPRILKIIHLIHEFCQIQGLEGEPEDES